MVSFPVNLLMSRVYFLSIWPASFTISCTTKSMSEVLSAGFETAIRKKLGRSASGWYWIIMVPFSIIRDFNVAVSWNIHKEKYIIETTSGDFVQLRLSIGTSTGDFVQLPLSIGTTSDDFVQLPLSIGTSSGWLYKVSKEFWLDMCGAPK